LINLRRQAKRVTLAGQGISSKFASAHRSWHLYIGSSQDKRRYYYSRQSNCSHGVIAIIKG
jgi:hypothetical protein